ncbi:hypothetical protein [Natrinema altunense]|uniref:Uncharacterized protein n=1 Tax=Natrinema altunense TaxID=222984 RepID=A0A482Y1M2_9EURY|nr:hypothetical protein [Natrinema altunense]RZH68780.1 hypothetical protein ELS17_04780 [Natrinema altunense]
MQLLCCTTHGGPGAAPVPEEIREVIVDAPDSTNAHERLCHRCDLSSTIGFTNRSPHVMDWIIECRLEQDVPDPVRERGSPPS